MTAEEEIMKEAAVDEKITNEKNVEAEEPKGGKVADE